MESQPLLAIEDDDDGIVDGGAAGNNSVAASCSRLSIVLHESYSSSGLAT